MFHVKHLREKMNEKIKTFFAWLGGIGAVVLAFLLGRGRNPDRQRISDIKDSVDNGRLEADRVGELNQQFAVSTDRAKQAVVDLAKGAERLGETMQRATGTVEDAHRAVDEGLRVLAEAEKRANRKND